MKQANVTIEALEVEIRRFAMMGMAHLETDVKRGFVDFIDSSPSQLHLRTTIAEAVNGMTKGFETIGCE